MKILILYTYNKGLLSNFFQDLSKKLVLDGFAVVNFYLKHKKEFFTQDGASFFGEPKAGYLKNYMHIYKIIKQTQPDIIISNFSYVNPALLFGKLLGVKQNIVWFHTVHGHNKPSRLKLFIKQQFLRMADVIIANSYLLQEEMHKVYKVPKIKTHAIPFWTNISEFQSDHDVLSFLKKDSVIHIGCPGRMVADKNHALVINALYQLKKQNKNAVKLYIAGDGTQINSLKKLVNHLHLENDVVFLGLLHVNEMKAFYEAMDVVVLPSFHEAFGLVFIEAIAVGAPVLVSKNFGALDFIDKQKYDLDAFSFDLNSMKALLDKLERYIDHKGKKGDYFIRMYDTTFKKELIYNQIKTSILKTN